MTDQLKYHLERQEDLEACCQLLSNILEVLYKKDVVSAGWLCDQEHFTEIVLVKWIKQVAPEALEVFLKFFFYVTS